MLSYVLYNKDNRVITYFLKKFKEKLPSVSVKTPTFLSINLTSENDIPFLES